MKTTAIIPVKKESGRLKNKNILPFADSNLLSHKIEQLKQVPEIDSIVVSSDSDYMLELARTANVTAIKRPAELANESKPFSDFIDYLCKVVDGEHFVYACATSPLVEPEHYSDALQTYFAKIANGYDSLITVMRFQHFLLDDNAPINFRRGTKHVNSQELPVLWGFTNGIIIAPRVSMTDWHYHFGVNPYYYEVNKDVAIDIDDEHDYQCALAIYKYNRAKLNEVN